MSNPHHATALWSSDQPQSGVCSLCHEYAASLYTVVHMRSPRWNPVLCTTCCEDLRLIPRCVHQTDDGCNHDWEPLFALKGTPCMRCRKCGKEEYKKTETL